MSREEIIEALAHLVALLVAERNSPPESGGWVRTENTAYRPPTPKGGKGSRRARNALRTRLLGQESVSLGSVRATTIRGRFPAQYAGKRGSTRELA